MGMRLMLAVPIVSMAASESRSFDIALNSILSRADEMGSFKLAVQSEFAALDETFLPALSARLEHKPSEQLWAVQDAFGEVLFKPELVRTTVSDDIILQHWRSADDYWSIGEDEELTVNTDGLPNGSAPPESRASTYGEITRTGGRALFLAMGLTERRAAAAVFVDLGSGSGRLVAQAWLDLAPAAVIRRAVGVELAPTRHAVAQSAWASVVAAGAAPTACAVSRAVPRLAKGPEFVLGSLLEWDLAEATHVYVCSKCLPEHLLDALWVRLRDAAPRLEVVAFVEQVRMYECTHHTCTCTHAHAYPSRASRSSRSSTGVRGSGLG